MSADNLWIFLRSSSNLYYRIALTGEQIASLKAAVETGEYATTSEIVREDIRDWQFKHELRQEDLKRRGNCGTKAKPAAL